MNKNLPFEITSDILNMSLKISEIIGFLKGLHFDNPKHELRKKNKVRTIHNSLAIEGNKLTEQQVTALIDGHKVIGPQKDIIEVQNAIHAYDHLLQLNPMNEKDLLKARALMMKGLIPDEGKYRFGNVGVFCGSNVCHMAPPKDRVPELMSNLFEFLNSDKKTPLLIKACVFHYEFEFIHPFSDGNGRMGRFWQQLILTKYNELFAYLSIESLIRLNQNQYYSTLQSCDKKGNSTEFILFSLNLIKQELESLVTQSNGNLSFEERIFAFSKAIGEKAFSRKDYINFFKNISSSTASRDLAESVEQGILNKIGLVNKSKYRFNLMYT